MKKPPHKAAPLTGAPTIEHFGKDHWSTLAFIEYLCVDHRGRVSDKHRQNMRTNIQTHPGHGHFPYGPIGHEWKAQYDTRLKDGSQIPNHDDWDCAEDLEEAGMIENAGSGINPVYKMTETGWRYAAALRKHKASGGSFSNFEHTSYDKVPV